MIIDLFKLLSHRDEYEKVIKFVREDFVPREAWEMIEAVPGYHADVGSPIEDWNNFYMWFAFNYPSSKYLNLIKNICDTLATDTRPASPAVIQILHNRVSAEAIAGEAIRIAEGKINTFSGLQDLLDTYKRTSIKLEKNLVEDVQESMLESLQGIKTTGMSWYVQILNTLLGPLNHEFILLASRPDGGKTTLLANEAWHIAQQLPDGKQVLWFNNEEHIRKVKLRVIQSYLGYTKEDILKDMLGAVRKYESHFGKDKIIFIDDANHISKVEKALDKYDPGLIIIDQLYKVQGAVGNKQDLEAERFRKLCEWARNLAKHVCPVIASNQMDPFAEGVKYPPMTCLYGSKTGAQGEADAILFLGKTPVDGNKRFVYTPKNKLTGSNVHYEVLLDGDKARYINL